MRSCLAITAATLLMAFAEACAAAPLQPDQATLERLVDEAFPDEGPGGVVLVSRDGRVLLHRAYGLANVELDVPMRRDSVFLIGSITKQFTAVAVLQLVQAGRVALDDDIRKFVPELQTHGRTVTVRQLLTHTGGVPNLVDLENFDAISREPRDPAQLVALTNAMELVSEPGTAFHYSDSGYIALGALIERVGGVPYGRFIAERVATPLGLVDTRYGDAAAIIPRRASGYTFDEGAVRNAAYIDMQVPHAAGGLVSTAQDLLRWHTLLDVGKIINRDLLRQAWTPSVLASGERVGYGFGWKLCPFEGEPALGHGGFINGFTASTLHLRERGLDIVVLANQDSGRPEPSYLARQIARLLLTGDARLRTADVPTEQLAPLLGTYRTQAGDLRRITQRDGVLYSQRNENVAIALVPLSAQVFAFPDSDGTHQLVFEPGPGGGVERVVTQLVCEPREVAQRLPGAIAP